jgi:hypothetical protein
VEYSHDCIFLILLLLILSFNPRIMFVSFKLKTQNLLFIKKCLHCIHMFPQGT